MSATILTINKDVISSCGRETLLLLKAMKCLPKRKLNLNNCFIWNLESFYLCCHYSYYYFLYSFLKKQTSYVFNGRHKNIFLPPSPLFLSVAIKSIRCQVKLIWRYLPPGMYVLWYFCYLRDSLSNSMVLKWSGKMSNEFDPRGCMPSYYFNSGFKAIIKEHEIK